MGDYQVMTVWDVVKRFLAGWMIAGVLLVAISCIKYRAFIAAVLMNSTSAWVNLILSFMIMIFIIKLFIGLFI